MKETIDLLGKIITNILTALYEPFGFSLLLSFLAMFFYLYAYEPIHAGKGWKSAIVTWYQKFKESVFFRKLFFLAFVTSLILFRTLLNRNLWMNPLSDVMGGWGIWETVNAEQKLTTECIENVIMMVPFSAVVMWTFGEKIGNGWKNAIVTWYQKFKESVFFRRLFFLSFVTSLILFRTLLNRQLWMNPLSDVMGGWGIWETVNGEQKLTTECIENVIMMVPFSAVVMWTFGKKIGNSWKKILWYSGKIAFIFSVSIEMLQLLLRLGTFQLSDIFYNTVGGMLGGLVYYVTMKARKHL